MSTGASSGTVIRRKICHSFAPSIRAASRASRGSVASPAPISTIANPVQIHRYAPMIAGVTSIGPSHDTPWYGCAKFDAGNSTV
ncbi:hypothetical protein RKD46_006482 [Streptomyces pseudovenezuelae]